MLRSSTVFFFQICSSLYFIILSDSKSNNNEVCSTATVNFNLTKFDQTVASSAASDSQLSEFNNHNNNNNNHIEPAVIEHVYGVIDYRGGRLTCPESGVELIVPENAIPYGIQREMFVKVCRDTAQNPPLDKDKHEALMSPLVMCGPQGLHFAVPVELKLPHDTTTNADDENLESGEELPATTSFVLKSGSGQTWRNIELLKPPRRNNPKDKFVTVLVSHFWFIFWVFFQQQNCDLKSEFFSSRRKLDFKRSFLMNIIWSFF